EDRCRAPETMRLGVSDEADCGAWNRQRIAAPMIFRFGRCPFSAGQAATVEEPEPAEIAQTENRLNRTNSHLQRFISAFVWRSSTVTCLPSPTHTSSPVCCIRLSSRLLSSWWCAGRHFFFFLLLCWFGRISSLGWFLGLAAMPLLGKDSEVLLPVLNCRRFLACGSLKIHAEPQGPDE